MSKQRLFWIIVGATLIITAVVIGVLLWQPQAKEVPVTILDHQGEPVMTLTSKTVLKKDPRWAYVDIVLNEAVQLLAQQYGCSVQEAQAHLFGDGITIQTAFDSGIFEKMHGAVTQYDLPIGCAITDLKGNLLAVVSTDSRTNYASAKTAPYSAFKPLSVYAPALEAGQISWTTTFEDSPYKTIQGADGGQTGWPANVTGTYTGGPVDISQGIAQSINTLAVKCLAQYGVDNSMDFLQNKLGIPLLQEQQAAELYGQEEILGSLALGYLEAGVSPADMAGYYQMFSNGGTYLAPKAILRMENAAGTNYYIRQELPQQVLQPATADLMNKLLQQVVATGTGKDAACGDIQVAGKTGTGDDNSDNWFVGITPGYSCAVWHGSAQTNQASGIFSRVIQGVYETQPKANLRFITHHNLYPITYCTESFQAAVSGCSGIAVGYFPNKDPLALCNLHNGQN